MTLASNLFDQQDSESKVFLITGATGAIGKAIAQQLANNIAADILNINEN